MDSGVKYTATDAVISASGFHRYTLERDWSLADPENQRRVCWVMLNPSTADSVEDDATIRRCVRFSMDWGYTSLVVVNLFAYRTRNPKLLRNVWREFAIGPDNDDAIRAAALNSSLVVCAWGVHGAMHGRSNAVRRLLQSVGTRPKALGITRDGEPAHPLYVPASRQPEEMPWLS